MSNTIPADPPPEPERPVAVLLVDDQLLFGEAVRRMLVSEPDVRYRYVADPRQALDVAREFRPTAILSDLVMPQMDGLELVRRFREEESTRKIPLIVLSSKEEAATKAEAFARGANDYLVKLPDRVELLARVRYHSARYRSMLERDAAYEALRQSQAVLRDELDQAAKYVLSLLPDPLDERVRARWRFIPCASLGGDAFGYHWLDDDHFVVYLLDVSGHGVGAALLGVSVLNALRSRSLPETDFEDPGRVLTGLGGAFPMDARGGKFFTIWYGVFRPSTRELSWAGGGHPPALLFVPGSPRPTPLDSHGTMPGLVPGIAYETSRTLVPPAARLLLYSDGLYEIRKADRSAYNHDEMVDDLATGGAEVLDCAVERAERLCAGSGFDDDLSAVEIAFP
ncbi:MAG: SpoIIE family protein phosphatase [candidate division NC10 bacterium]